MSVERVQRLLRLITTLQSGNANRSADLMLELGISRRTLFRDLKLIQKAGIPSYHQPGRGYRIAQSYFLPPINLTVPETLGLMLLGKTVASQPNRPLLGPALAAINKVTTTVPEPIRSACLDLMAPVTLSPGPHAQDGLEARYYTTLQRCIDEGRVCAMTYKSPVEPQALECRLEPLGMHFAARAWYVLGRTNLYKEVRIFKLVRVQRLTPTVQLFTRPRNFRLPPRFRHAWQLNPEGRMHRIDLEFTAKVGTNVAEVRWHPSQKHRLLPDGRCLMSFHVDGIREIAWWLCGYADQVVVRRPAALRTLLGSMHRSAAALDAPRAARPG